MAERGHTSSPPKVLVIGLDCATPEFVFHHPEFHLPNLHRLMDSGTYGTLLSCHPPITVPAWACMTTGRDPGALGIYGFRNRSSRDTYGEYKIATSTAVREPRIWDILSSAGKQVCVVGVPQTFPATPVNGSMVTSILTPGLDSPCTYPESLKSELIEAVGDIVFDVENFRALSPDSLLEQLNALRDNRFAIATHLMTHKPWDFFMMVEMGVDRLHHGFWHYADPNHPQFEEDNPYRWAIRDYYERLDRQIGDLLALAGPETKVMVVSDHGAKAMHGGIRLNQWLMDEGYLVYKAVPTGPEPFDPEKVDWTRTVAWGEGGYYGRIYLNVRDREPQGIVAPTDATVLLAEISTELIAMRGPSGTILGNEAHLPRQLYPVVNGIEPDLMVYFGGLYWRSLGEVGCNSVFADSNDTGTDGANHALEGLVILSTGGDMRQFDLHNAQLMDVAPTVLQWMGVPIPAAMQGRVLRGKHANRD